MPEGPEIKIVTEWLNEYCTTNYILDCSNYKNKDVSMIKGYQITNVTCKGKQIFFKLEYPNFPVLYINSRLALEGMWVPQEKKHTRFWIILTNNISTKNLIYNDIINWGGLDILNQEQYIKKLSEIGPDLLSDNVEYQYYYSIITNKRIKNKQICDFLMEQKYFSGIGNYLKAEILYASKIRPDRVLQSLSEYDIYQLYINSIEIIKRSYDSGGATIHSFQTPDGKMGMFERCVYSKQYDPFGNPIVQNTFKDKRTTYWVPNIQV